MAKKLLFVAIGILFFLHAQNSCVIRSVL